jgi:DEAD/DEAH box helicase domain-containing protein
MPVYVTASVANLMLTDARRVPVAARLACQAAELPYRDGLHAASHAVLNVLPLHIACNSADMQAECDNPYSTRYRPERILMFDAHPGGIGLCTQVATLKVGSVYQSYQ